MSGATTLPRYKFALRDFLLAEFNSILFNFIAVRHLLNYLARFAKFKFQKMTQPIRVHYTITTYFDIVGLQVLHSTQYTTLYVFRTTIHCIHSSDNSTSDILYIVLLTLYPVRYRYNTVLLHLPYIIQNGFIFEVWKTTHSNSA